jgi:hypothetical protein
MIIFILKAAAAWLDINLLFLAILVRRGFA